MQSNRKRLEFFLCVIKRLFIFLTVDFLVKHLNDRLKWHSMKLQDVAGQFVMQNMWDC